MIPLNWQTLKSPFGATICHISVYTQCVTDIVPICQMVVPNGEHTPTISRFSVKFFQLFVTVVTMAGLW